MAQTQTSSGDLDPALYVARVDNTGGTTGQVDIAGVDGPHPGTLPTGGPMDTARGYNPEQFLAMAWSTCLGETLKVVIGKRGLEARSAVTVEVEMHDDPAGGFRFVPRATVTIDGVDAATAQDVLDAAHARCPVSKLLTGRGGAMVRLDTGAQH
jgi:osmotically inducible protein OsmC